MQRVVPFLILFGVGISVNLISCSETKETPQPAAEPNKINIKGFTAYDEFGSALGENDPEDWTLNATWPAEVVNLMNAQPELQNYDSLSDVVMVNEVMLFPNPVSSNCNLKIDAPTACMCKLLWVDEQLNVLSYSQLKINAGVQQLILAPPPQITAKPLRLYYSFLNNNKKVVYQGWGDVIKK
ncbi:MAG: hypothetical protein ACK5UI_06755 [Bacteroidota bacterium]|jgi:hypothetical protein